MALEAGARKAEHGGPKHGKGPDHKADVKKASRKFRRRNAKAEIKEQLESAHPIRA